MWPFKKKSEKEDWDGYVKSMSRIMRNQIEADDRLTKALVNHLTAPEPEEYHFDQDGLVSVNRKERQCDFLGEPIL